MYFEFTGKQEPQQGMTFAVWHRYRAIFSICGTDRAIALMGKGFTNAKQIQPAAKVEIREGFRHIGYHELN